MRDVVTPKPSRETTPTGAATSGFQAKIKGASLADLVQMECLAGSRKVVKVGSDDHVGYLYFRGGAVIHAVTSLLSGEAAVLEMLAWSAGTFEPVERDWPTRDTISSNWQNLLLRAAQAHDERAAGSVVALRTDGGDRRSRARADQTPVGESIEFDVTPLLVAGHTLRKEDFELFLRMNRDGAVVASHGAHAPDFADVAAYALRLSQLVGEELGLDRFLALECTFKQGRCFIVLEDDGSVVALEPRTTIDSASLRELFAL